MSARMPPSPRLSARITNTRYLMETMMIRAQKISDITPRMFRRFGSTAWGPKKHSRMA